MGQAIEASEKDEALCRLEAGFEKWRLKRRGKERIPEALWIEATSVARGHGINQVSRRLGLDYNALKRRTEKSNLKFSRQKSAEFVEIDMKDAPMMNGCLIELARGGGERLTIRLPRAAPADIQGWMTTFWVHRP